MVDALLHVVPWGLESFYLVALYPIGPWSFSPDPYMVPADKERQTHF